MTERIDLEVENGLARVQLNRPEKHNALDLPMFEALAAAQRRLAQGTARAVGVANAPIAAVRLVAEGAQVS